MEDRSGEIHVTTDEARSGSTPHIVRWVLAISLLAAIIILSAMWMTSASLVGGEEQQDTAQAVADERADEDATDSIVSDQAEQAPR
ncbi:MAG: hypothetical protein WA842_08730 [Croceibacterium sp.]